MSQARIERLVFLPEHGSIEFVQSALSIATKTIDVCMFWFDERTLADALLAAHRSGVRVRVLVDERSLRGMVDGAGSRTWLDSVPRHLARNGVPVAVYGSKEHIMHHKFVLLDRDPPHGRVLLTTGNWHHEDRQYNQDTMMIIDDPVALRRLGEWFDETFGACPSVRPFGARIRVLQEGIRHGTRQTKRAIRRRLRNPLKLIARRRQRER